MSDYIIDTYLVPQKRDMEKWIDSVENSPICTRDLADVYKRQLIYWASTYIHCANFNTVLLENSEHTINLQKACARINQLEAENKALKAGIETLHFESQSKLFKVQSQPPENSTQL